VSRLGGVGSRKKDCGKIQDLTPREPRISRPDPSAALTESHYWINVQYTSAYIAAHTLPWTKPGQNKLIYIGLDYTEMLWYLSTQVLRHLLNRTVYFGAGDDLAEIGLHIDNEPGA